MKKYKAGIYLRLSKEDTNTNNSIEAQRYNLKLCQEKQYYSDKGICR